MFSCIDLFFFQRMMPPIRLHWKRQNSSKKINTLCWGGFFWQRRLSFPAVQEQEKELLLGHSEFWYLIRKEERIEVKFNKIFFIHFSNGTLNNSHRISGFLFDFFFFLTEVCWGWSFLVDLELVVKNLLIFKTALGLAKKLSLLKEHSFPLKANSRIVSNFPLLS